MKHFVFRLASVLTIRAREEDLAREVFSKAAQAQSKATLDLEQARAELDDCYAALVTGRTGATSRTEQILLLNALQHQQSQCEHLAVRLAVADRDAAVRRAEFLAVRRKREVLTRLRERQSRAHRIEMERREENEVGDLITARHVRGLQEVTA
jgi:flagellar export protein FliJ